MGLHRCIDVLAQRGMGRGKTAEEVAEERMLVTGARVWLGVSPTSEVGADRQICKTIVE